MRRYEEQNEMERVYQKMSKKIIGCLSFVFLVFAVAYPSPHDTVQGWLQYLAFLVSLGYMFA